MATKAQMTQEQMMAALQQQIMSVGQQAGDPYGQLLSEFTVFAGDRAFLQHGVGTPEPGEFDIGPIPYTVSQSTGRLLFKNGVVADPTTGEVTYPPSMYRDPEKVEGSNEWLRAIQTTWSAKQANSWRKRLAAQGYEIAESGGMAYDLLNGLREYHRLRYLNGGEALIAVPTTAETRERIRESVDFQALKEEAKGWGEAVFGEALGESEADYLAERMVQRMTKLAKEKPEWSLEQLQAGATLRTQREFVKDEDVAASLQEAEEDEMDETLRDSIVSISQVASI